MLRIVSLAIAIVSVLNGAPSCHVLTSRQWQFEFCRPDGWGAHLETRNLPFLCSKPVRMCTMPGGAPDRGVAAVWVTPVEASGSEKIAGAKTLDDLSGALAGSRSIAKKEVFRGINGAVVEWVQLERETPAGLNETLVSQNYAISVGGRLFSVLLQYWAADTKTAMYLKDTEALIRSIRSTK
jgi:hypothetical protein